MKQKTDNLDVIVIGAGSAGSRVACGLAEAGNNVLVIDKNKDINNPVCCTGIISNGCVNEFRVPRNIILREYNRASIYSPGGKRIALKRPQQQAYTVDRSAFNNWLAQEAVKAGAKYSFDKRAKKVAVSSEGVRVTLEKCGQEYEIKTRALVIAAGCNSKIAVAAGFKPPPDKVFGIQVDAEIVKLEEVELYLGKDIAQGLFGWAVPITETRARVGLMARRNPRACILNLISKLEKQGKIIDRGEEAVCRSIPLSMAPKTYNDRVLLVGDSAGQNKPTTGGGIYFGLLTADIAAECLKEALREDDLSAIRLRDYQKKWRKLIGQDIKLGRLARRFYQHLNDKQIDKIFDIATKEDIVEEILKEKDITFDWHGKVIMELAAKKILTRLSRITKIPPKLNSSKKEL